MAAARSRAGLARALAPTPLLSQLPRRWPRRCASTAAGAADASARRPADLDDLASTTSFTTPPPDQAMVESFNEAQKQRLASKERRLPSNRFVSPSYPAPGAAALLTDR